MKVSDIIASPDATYTLLIACPDQPGIVATVARFLFERGGNIIESDQHSTDPHAGTFFMRVRFTHDACMLGEAEFAAAFAPIAATFGMRWSLASSRARLRAVIFVSKLDHCLTDLLWRWRHGELAMDIPWIVGNHRELEPLASMYGVPFHYAPISREGRADEQRRLLDTLAGAADLLILARYMQVLEPFVVAAYPHRILNIHHSFLPAFPGAQPYQRAFERGVKLIGATAHYVTDQLDEGPIIAQDVIHCDHRDTPDDLVRKGRDVERRVLSEAVRLHIEHRVLVHQAKTIVF